MRPMQVTVVGSTGGPASNGISAILPLDYVQAPFNVGIGTYLSTGTATWSVQHTFDDLQNSAVVPVWFNNTGINAVSAQTDGNYAFPVRGIRLNVSAGTGTVVMDVIQGRRGS
jgi:hypothetical protein